VKTLKNIFQFYINSSIHVALAISALAQITFLKLGINDNNSYIFLLFCFLASVVGYNFVKYSRVSSLHHRKLTKSMKAIRVVTFLCAILLIIAAVTIPYDVLIYMLPFAILTLLYTIPVFPNKKNLRSVAGIKIFIIGLVWAGTTVFIPIIYTKAELSFNFLIEMIQRFLFVIVLMLPFEIRDLQYDAKTLETVPQKIGITRTKVFGSILLVVFLLLTAIKDQLSVLEILSTILITTISLLFLWGTEKKQSEYYCSFWVESVPLMWLLTIIVLQHLFL